MLAIKLNDTGTQSSKDLIVSYEKVMDCLDCLSTVQIPNLKQLSNLFLTEFVQELWFHRQCDDQEAGTSDECDGFSCCGCPTMDTEFRKALLRVECNCQNEHRKEEYINSDVNMQIIDTINADNDKACNDMINQFNQMRYFITGRVLITLGYLPVPLIAAYDLISMLYCIHDAGLPYSDNVIHVAVCKTSSALRLYSIVITYDTPEMKRLLLDLNLGQKTKYFNVMIMKEEDFFHKYVGLTRISSGYVRTGAELEEFAKSNVSICFKLTSVIENNGDGDVFRVIAQQLNLNDITSAAIIHVAGAIGSTYSNTAGLHMLKVSDLVGNNCLILCDQAFPIIAPIGDELTFKLTLPANKAIVGPVADDDGNVLVLDDIEPTNPMYPNNGYRYKMIVTKNTNIHIPYTTIDTCADRVVFLNDSESYQLRTWRFDKYTQIIIQNIQTTREITIGNLDNLIVVNNDTQKHVPMESVVVKLQCERKTITPTNCAYVYSLYLMVRDTSFKQVSIVADSGVLLSEDKQYTNRVFSFIDKTIMAPDSSDEDVDTEVEHSYSLSNWIIGGDPIVVFDEMSSKAMTRIEIPFYFDGYNWYKTGLWEFNVNPSNMSIRAISETGDVSIVPYKVFVEMPGQHHNASEFPILCIQLDTIGVKRLLIDTNDGFLYAKNTDVSIAFDFLPCSCTVDVVTRRLVPAKANYKIHFENFADLHHIDIRYSKDSHGSFIIVPLKKSVPAFSKLNSDNYTNHVNYKTMSGDVTVNSTSNDCDSMQYTASLCSVIDYSNIPYIYKFTSKSDKEFVAYNDTYRDCMYTPDCIEHLSIFVHAELDNDFEVIIPEGLVVADYHNSDGSVYMNREYRLRFSEKKGE